MPAPPNYVFTIFSFVAFFLCLIKFPMQFNVWNIGIHLFLAWVGLQCLFLGINSIVWNHNTVNWAPGWCDITTRFSVGVAIAIPAIVLCINRRLYLLASPNSKIPSQAEKNRELIIYIFFGIGLPIIAMVLSFLVQSSRFIIAEDYGCSTAFLPTWLLLVIISIPSIVLELIAGVYGCLSIHAFYYRSKLDETHNINRNQYIRLMCFSVCDLLCGIPITLFYLYLDIVNLVPFPGIKQEHNQFSLIYQVPAVVWRSTTLSELSYELNRWIIVWGAFVFFAVFGFTEESRNNYRAVYRATLQPVFQFVNLKMRRVESRSSSTGTVTGTMTGTMTGTVTGTVTGSKDEGSLIYNGSQDSTWM